MISYGEDHLGGPPLRTQVCVVGSGPAGITLAHYLVKRGLDVILLEGSRTFGRDPNVDLSLQSDSNAYDWNDNNWLYNGESTGYLSQSEPHFLIQPSRDFPGYPGWERERIYGGTGTHWGGQSRPLDALTFEQRPGFPGWPITREMLDPYYEEACAFMGLYGPYYSPDSRRIPGYNFTAEFWANELGSGYAVAAAQGFDVDMYQFPPQSFIRFQSRRYQDGKTIGESAARVILNASLLDIERQNGNVSALSVGVMTNNTSSDSNLTKPQNAGQFTVEADAYVLACGAVANARLLLLSGFGEDNDLIGRYLMGQPLATGVNAVSTFANWLSPPESNLIQYIGNLDPKFGLNALKGVLTPEAEVARQHQIGSVWFGTDGTSNYYHELLPEYTSRVMLSDSVDPVFGQRQTKVDWQLNPNEATNYETLAQLFTTAVQAKDPGASVAVTPWADLENTMVFNGHHLGTTRMSASAADGVVDSDLKMHGVDNLYVAGSSIWASAGISNPTFSIITFSIRLAEHLEHRLGTG